MLTTGGQRRAFLGAMAVLARTLPVVMSRSLFASSSGSTTLENWVAAVVLHRAMSPGVRMEVAGSVIRTSGRLHVRRILGPGTGFAAIPESSFSTASPFRFRACKNGGRLVKKSPSAVNHARGRCQGFRSGSSFLGGARSLCTSTVRDGVDVQVPITVEESTVVDADFQIILEQLEKDAPQAVRLAVDGMDEAEFAKTIELSVVICSDAYIRELNSQWLGKDSPTDVLSFPQAQAPGVSSIWLLGDVVISIDTAARQAKERGHTLLDEVRILLVHGLLHVLGYDHEEGPEEAQDMEDAEKHILNTLGWQGDGLINFSLQAANSDDGSTEKTPTSVSTLQDTEATKRGQAGASQKSARHRSPPFKLLFCDMDGTLLNSQSKVTNRTADAVRAAITAGVQVVIATGKARPAAIAALDAVGLAHNGGAISVSTPGVFLQGLLVYGQGGSLVHRNLLSSDICSEAFAFSLKHRTPLVGFTGDQCVTLFEHPNLDMLHTVFYEPKAQVMPSIEHIVTTVPIQKLLFCDSKASVAEFLRPHWYSATRGRATVVQAVPEMLEILPPGASKGSGVQLLLDHLHIPPEEVMAIGDGENDREMLQLVGLGVAMANGAAETLAVADAQVSSNDDDGVAEAIQRYIL